MNTNDFLKVLKKEKAFDFIPTLNLFGVYILPVHIFARLIGVKTTILLLITGLILGVYMTFKPEVQKAFVKWWNNLSETFHFTLFVLLAGAVLVLNKAFLIKIKNKFI